MKILKVKTICMGLVAMVALSIGLISCDNQHTKIDYKTAEGYFVLNTIKNDGAYEKKFTSKEDFDSYFGMASTMSVDSYTD